MSTNPLDIYKEFDPKMIESFNSLQDVVFCEGALKLGATREEIIETLRVSYYVGGNRAPFTSAQVLQNLFKQDRKP